MESLEMNEPIQVLADFHPAPVRPTGAGQARRIQVIPRAFIWKNRRYFLKSLNLVHHERQGEVTVYYFSVSTATNTYKLAFNTVSLEWRLVEVWSE